MKNIYLIMMMSLLPLLGHARNDVLYGYQWMEGSPQVLRTSQVFSGENQQLCGNPDYEICIGPANNPARPNDPVKIVKCYIAKNSTICPTTLNAESRCSLANEAAPAGGTTSVPACHRRHPERDNTPQGCHCGEFVSRGNRIIKRNIRECLALVNTRRDSQQRNSQAQADEERCRLLPRSVWRSHDQICLSRCGTPDVNGICTCTISTGGSGFGEQFGSGQCPQ